MQTMMDAECSKAIYDKRGLVTGAHPFFAFARVKAALVQSVASHYNRQNIKTKYSIFWYSNRIPVVKFNNRRVFFCPKTLFEYGWLSTN